MFWSTSTSIPKQNIGFGVHPLIFLKKHLFWSTSTYIPKQNICFGVLQLPKK